MIPALPRVFSILCAIAWAGPALAESRAAPIRDDAGLFHAVAIASAEQRIADIHRTFNHNLFVRTVASASPSQRRLFPFLTTPKVNRLLKEQADKYADEVGADGIYVVICQQPRDVHVIVRPATDVAFSRRDGESLRRMLARSLHDKGADTALLVLVDQVQATLKTHPANGSSQSMVHDFVLLGLLGGGFALWLLLCLLRHKMRGGHALSPSEGDELEQARQTPALLGALFGCPAGLWIYDKLYPCPAGTSAPLCEPESPPHRPEEERIEPMDTERQPMDEHTEDAPVSP